MTRSRTPAFAPLLALLAVMVSGASTFGQDSSCTYERCALGYAQGFWGEYLVKGVQAERVGRLGLRAPRLALLEGRTDSAGIYYGRFRAWYTAGNVLALAGGLAFGVGYVLATERRGGVVLPLVSLGTGTVLGVLGASRTRQGRNALHRAIWWYNRSLAP